MADAKKLLPDPKTMEELGYKGFSGQARGWLVRSGTPKEIVDILTRAFKKAMETSFYKERIDQTGHTPSYLDPEQFGVYWDKLEAEVLPLMEVAKKEAKR